MLPNPLAERERRAGREGFVQYMLASLMLGQQPPADNTPATPSGRGEAFLYALHRHVLGQQLSPPLTFVNQLRLEGVDERGNGWADHGALSPDHVTVVELKTDPGSIREGQVDWYLELALHQYPGRVVSLLYVTREPVATAPPALPARASYANTTWQDVARLIAEQWQDEHDSWSHAVAIMFADYLREQIRPAPDGPDLRRGSRQPESRAPPQAPAGLSADTEVTGPYGNDELVLGLGTARDVALDGRQRGIPLRLESPDDAKAYSRQLKAFLAGHAEGEPALARVFPVVWYRFSSGGTALTREGEQTDVEVRVSRSRRPIEQQQTATHPAGRPAPEEPTESSSAPGASSQPGAPDVGRPEPNVARLRGMLRYWATGFARSSGKVSPDAPFNFGARDLEPDEANGFLRAYDHGLVVVDADARFQLPGAGCPPNPRLVGKKAGSDVVALNTEYLIQIAAYAELILDHGWLPASLSLEMGEFDLVAVDRAGDPVILVEAKARLTGPNSLEHLWQAFRAWAAGGEVSADATTRRKWKALREHLNRRPLTLWLVASGARWGFVTREVDGQVEFAPRHDLPRP